MARERLKTQLRQLAATAQAGFDGTPPADLSFEAWLTGQPTGVQQQILGQTRWRLWHAGKLRLTKLTDQRHRPATIADLKRQA